MQRFVSLLALVGLLFSFCTDASALCCRRAHRCRISRCCSSCPASPTVCAAAATNASGSADPATQSKLIAASDPITAEEQGWYDELRRKEYIGPNYAIHWKNDSHAERRKLYYKIIAIENDVPEEFSLQPTGK